MFMVVWQRTLRLSSARRYLGPPSLSVTREMIVKMSGIAFLKVCLYIDLRWLSTSIGSFAVPCGRIRYFMNSINLHFIVICTSLSSWSHRSQRQYLCQIGLLLGLIFFCGCLPNVDGSKSTERKSRGKGEKSLLPLTVEFFPRLLSLDEGSLPEWRDHHCHLYGVSICGDKWEIMACWSDCRRTKW